MPGRTKRTIRRRTDRASSHVRVDLHAQAFFTHLARAGLPFDPRKPLTEPPNGELLEADPVTGLRDRDFDAIELLNGPDMDR